MITKIFKYYKDHNDLIALPTAANATLTEMLKAKSGITTYYSNLKIVLKKIESEFNN